MKTTMLFLLTLILALVLAGSTPTVASAGDAGVPFKANYQVDVTLVFNPVTLCLEQKFHANSETTHLGINAWDSNALSCLDGSQTGDMVFTAANGDQLFGNYVGTHVGYPGLVTFGGNFQITGGTGRFCGMTGSGDYGGTADMSTATNLLYFDGRLFKSKCPK